MQKFVFYLPRHNSSSISFCCVLVIPLDRVCFSVRSGTGLIESKSARAALGRVHLCRPRAVAFYSHARPDRPFFSLVKQEGSEWE